MEDENGIKQDEHETIANKNLKYTYAVKAIKVLTKIAYFFVTMKDLKVIINNWTRQKLKKKQFFDNVFTVDRFKKTLSVINWSKHCTEKY